MKLLCEPDTFVFFRVTRNPSARGTVIEYDYGTSLIQMKEGYSFGACYWPRVGVPFDGRNGQGYQVLSVVFDDKLQVRDWFWQQPTPIISGGIGALVEAENYWDGIHSISGPPPKGRWFGGK